MRTSELDPTDVFNALSDPIRWNIVRMMAETDELACTLLQGQLKVSKSTVSYHIKILSQAGLIDVRKDGRFYFYRLRRETVGAAVDQLMGELMSGPPRNLTTAQPAT